MQHNYLFMPISKQYNLADKDLAVSTYVRYMAARTQAMFKYKNLPESIPQRELELQLQLFGHVGVIDVDGSLYALRGGFGGEPNPYYMPTIYTIANPALKLSKQFKIDDDVVIIRNDSMYMGLSNMFLRYATQLTENDLSMLIAIINSRIINLLIAGDDAAYESAKKYIDDVIAGKMGIIGDSKILESIRTQPYAAQGNRTITELIEMQQYLKAGWFNELGLNANYNMKREAINADEAQMNHDALYPLIDDMLNCRKECIEKVNDMFGTSIEVEFNSVWEIKEKELDATEEIIENTPEETEPVSYFNNDEPESETVSEPVEETAAEEPAEESAEEPAEEPEIIEQVEEVIEDLEEIIEDVKGGAADEG